VLLGGVLVDRIGFRGTTLLFAVASLTSVGFAWAVARSPEPRAPRAPPDLDARHRARRDTTCSQAGVLLSGFSYGFVLAGMLVTSAGLLLRDRIGDASSIATFTGLILGARWLSEIVLATPAGFAGDRLGRTTALPAIALLGAVCIIFVVMLQPVAWWVVAVAVMFLLGTALQVNAEASAGDLAAAPGRHHILGRYATAVDLGSAAGPLVTLPLVVAIGLVPTYLFGAALLLASAVLAAWPAPHRPLERSVPVTAERSK
jgi:predicted MFS family arabinose efflux permease